MPTTAQGKRPDPAQPRRAAPARPRQHPRLEGASAQLLLNSIIPYQINLLSYRMNRLLDQELRTHDLSISCWRIMAVLDFNASATVNELARYALIEQSTLSRILRRMEADGLLVIQVPREDGRVRFVSLTEAGRSKYDTVRSVTMKHVSRIVDGFSREERAILMSFISRMQVNVEAPPSNGEAPPAVVG